jgi:hypothetical protein
MQAGVGVAVAFLLSEMSVLLEKEEGKMSVWKRKWIRKRNQLCASNVHIFMKWLASDDTEIYKITLERQTT